MAALRAPRLLPQLARPYRVNASRLRFASTFTNILADDSPPPVQVSGVSVDGVQLADGLLLPGASILLEGKVFLWDVPPTLWEGWGKEHLALLEMIVPRPEILLLGTGKRISMPPPFLRAYLNQLGVQLDIMDTRNACSTYNLLSEEGRRVAAALLPWTPHPWKKREGVSRN